MIIELKPVDGRKSFYGKCCVEWDGEWRQLYSYGVHVASYNIVTNVFCRHWYGYSATTMRHVNAFMRYLGYALGGKKWWNSLTPGVPVKLVEVC